MQRYPWNVFRKCCKNAANIHHWPTRKPPTSVATWNATSPRYSYETTGPAFAPSPTRHRPPDLTHPDLSPIGASGAGPRLYFPSQKPGGRAGFRDLNCKRRWRWPPPGEVGARRRIIIAGDRSSRSIGPRRGNPGSPTGGGRRNFGRGRVGAALPGGVVDGWLLVAVDLGFKRLVRGDHENHPTVLQCVFNVDIHTKNYESFLGPTDWTFKYILNEKFHYHLAIGKV